ncbi:cupin domain-containing protein [Priestia aryabhattai]
MTLTNNKTTQELHLTATDENTMHFLVEKISFLLTGKDTNGEYDLAYVEEPPFGGPPPHRHNDDTEVFFIAQGTGKFVVDGVEKNVKSGDSVIAPKGSIHYFVAGEEGMTFFLKSYPSNFYNFVKSFGKSVPKDAPLPTFNPATDLDVIKLTELSLKYGITYHPELTSAIPKK